MGARNADGSGGTQPIPAGFRRSRVGTGDAVTEPDERPADGVAEPADEHDPELAEAYAESVPIDPSPEEVNHYLELVGAPEATGEPEDGEAVTSDPDTPTG